MSDNSETTIFLLSLIIDVLLVLANLGILALCYKLYTEYVKDRAQDMRRGTPPE